MGKLEGKIALITGGGSGIGRASALMFAAEGAKVSVVDRAEESARTVAAEITKGGGEAIAIRADVSKAVDTERMVAETVGHFGRLDVLYNNAGIGFARRTHLLTEEEWDRTIDVDLKGVFLGCKYALPELMKHGGVILSTASVAGLEGFRQMAAYCAAKAGVILLTKSLAMDYAEHGIRVNCICPGSIETPLYESGFENLTPEKRARAQQMFAAMHLLGRTGGPDEIARVALFLCSQDASFITGQAVVVDGGYTTGHRMIRLS
ncbi:MAG TPA: SDR family NAD(P)-dependent oxidoreductase [Candidatus Binataceae bacterium]|jgi:NAD(P)-dependent dehydrogenase (short-subunit alcohol dehydrogenase family)|nr:SDR family NAD(P)-dependent oxidoreductase [Candidatus Binataceae bacterium]